MRMPESVEALQPSVEIEPPKDSTRLARSFQTAPVAVPHDDSAKYLRSGFTREGFESPDWLVPDLEDGIAPKMRDEGIQNVIELLSEYESEFPGEVWPRIQWSYDSSERREAGKEMMKQIAEEAGDHVTGFVIPKVGWIDDVQEAEAAVTAVEEEAGYDPGTFEMSPIIETARAKEDLSLIARFGRPSRIHALVFGPVDYTAELGGRKIDNRRASWTSLVEDLSNATSANNLVGIGGPFDRIFHERAGVTIYNADAYADSAKHEARHGLDGSWSLHPNQTIQANRIHTPSIVELQSDVDNLEGYIEAKETGIGAILVDGQMVDEGTLREYRNTVKTVLTIHERHPDQTSERFSDSLINRARSLKKNLD